MVIVFFTPASSQRIELGSWPANSADPLPAAAAGRAERQLLGDDGDLDDLAAAAHDHMADRRGLGTPALGIGQVLDVGAGIDAAVLGADGGTDGEFRIGRVGRPWRRGRLRRDRGTWVSALLDIGHAAGLRRDGLADEAGEQDAR
jgi:hypothetical protein